MVENHFLPSEVAENYDRHRPYFHPLVFARLTQLTSTPRFGRALDIGCGTGQSTQAMREV
jgi:predicted TPR repeat methyltransferase